MAKRKLTPLVQAMNIFVTLDERDKATMADFVKSQTQVPRKPRKAKTEKQPALTEVKGSSAA